MVPTLDLSRLPRFDPFTIVFIHCDCTSFLFDSVFDALGVFKYTYVAKILEDIVTMS
jgi:hypothetical protein